MNHEIEHGAEARLAFEPSVRLPYLRTRRVHTFEAQLPTRYYYEPFTLPKGGKAPRSLTFYDGTVCTFRRAEPKPWGGLRLFYSA